MEEFSASAGIGRKVLLSFVMTVDLAASIIIEQHDIKRISTLTPDLHAGATYGHTGHGQAACLGLFGDQSLDVVRGHMSFDGITIDDGGVTGGQCARHTIAFPIRSGAWHIMRKHCKAILFEVNYPVFAASAAGSFIDRDLRFGGSNQNSRQQW